MATIVKKERKSGMAFLFQVKLTNPLTGEKIVKTTTYKPPATLTAKQAEREAAIQADRWEREVRSSHGVIKHNDDLTAESTFNEVAAKWLEKIGNQYSPSHHEASKGQIEIASAHIGKFKISKLTQGILQNFFDWLDKREKIVRKVRSKPEAVREVMKQKNETYATLTNNHKLNNFTICPVLSGKNNVSYEYALSFAKALNTDINMLFDIKETRELYAYNTNHHIKAAVRAVLSFAKKKRLVSDNYAKAEYIDFPKRVQKEIVCMNQEQIKQAYTAAATHEDIRYGTTLITLLFTGFRKGELCGLKWENIDLENRLITVNKSVMRVGKRGVIEKGTKTDKSKRTVEIPKILSAQLIRYREWYFNLKAQMGDRWDDSDWFLVNTDTGKRLSPDTVIAWVNNVTEPAGLGHWTVHSFRHTNITTKLLNNVPLLEVSSEAGHSRTSTTTDRYGHFLATHKRVAPAIFDNIITGAESGSR